MCLPRSRCQIEMAWPDPTGSHTEKFFKAKLRGLVCGTNALQTGLIWVSLDTILACQVELEVKLVRVKSVEKRIRT